MIATTCMRYCATPEPGPAVGIESRGKIKIVPSMSTRQSLMLPLQMGF
jgi:hypothetical protein